MSAVKAASIEDFLLHPELLLAVPLRGKTMSRRLRARAEEIKLATQSLKDPSLSVVIRTKNDRAYIEQLIKDIKNQHHNGRVEIIVVDTESRDGTAELAAQHGATVISLSQQEFTYPKALNSGFEMASGEYVVSLVGHSCLSSRYMFKALTYWSRQENFAGAYNLPLPNWNASYTEKWAWAVSTLPRHIKGPTIRTKMVGGIMGANSSIVKKSVWEQCGGYDERYAAGAEELPLARNILSKGLLLVEEPLMAVHHSHGLGPIDNVRQLWHWYTVSRQPLAFNLQELLKRRPDMRQKM